MDTGKIWGKRRKEEVEMKEWSDQHEWNWRGCAAEDGLWEKGLPFPGQVLWSGRLAHSVPCKARPTMRQGPSGASSRGIEATEAASQQTRAPSTIAIKKTERRMAHIVLAGVRGSQLRCRK